MRKFLLPAITALVFFSACASKQSTSDVTEVRKESNRKMAADFSLKDENGATVKLSDYRGKVVLLNYWATWCGPCQIEIPWFMDFEQKYKSQGFAVLGVSMDEDGWTAIKPFVGGAQNQLPDSARQRQRRTTLWRPRFPSDQFCHRSRG